MKAYPKENNLYTIVDEIRGESYKVKGKIAASGGRWDGRNWIVPESALKELKIEKMRIVSIGGYCCFKESETTYASESEINRGFVQRKCSKCDSSQWSQAKIILSGTA